MMGELRTRPSGLSLAAGYLPLVVVGALITAMVWIVPSEVPETVAAGGPVDDVAEEDVGTAASGWGDTVEHCDGVNTPQEDILDYSPPCFTFSGDNGGETHTGVSEDTVRVSFRHLAQTGHFIQTLSEVAGRSLGETPEDLWRTAEGLVEYFNENFEFYGRKIELVRFDGSGSLLEELFGAGQEAAGIDARTAAEQEVFADAMSVSQPYAEELVAEEVVSIGVPYMSREWFDERGAYAWSPFPDCTFVAEISADVLTERLLDEPVAMGQFEGEERQLGAVYPSNDQYKKCGDVFQDQIVEAGYEIPEPQTYPLDFAAAGANASAILDSLIRDGITSVGFAGDPIVLDALVAQAEQRNYEPEWIIPGVGFMDMDLVGQMIADGSGDQWSRAFGATASGTPVPFEEMDAYQAYKTVQDDEPTQALEFMYSLLLPLALGIQMAGPELTPETFADGLYRFPPTVAGMGALNFQPDNRAGRIDARFMFFNPEGESPFNGEPGTWADTGERFTEVEQAPTQEELLELAESFQ